MAALEIFRRDGVTNCRIDDIAQIAEVSRAAFYFHFPTKDDVLLELLRESETPIAKAIAELPAEAAFEPMLQVVSDAMAAFWQNEPKLLVDVATASLRKTTVLSDREAEPIRVAVSDRFRRAAERGEIASSLPPEVLADVFLVNCLAAMAAWSAAPMLPLQLVLRGVVHLFLNGARRPLPNS